MVGENSSLSHSSHPMSWFLIAGQEAGNANVLEGKINLGLESLPRNGTSTNFTSIHKGFGFGLVIPEKFRTLTTWSIFENEHDMCFVEGVFYDQFFSHQPVQGRDRILAKLILEKFASFQMEAIATLSGSFRGFIFNKRTGVVRTFVDRLSTRVLYWSNEKDRTIVSTNLTPFCKLKALELDRTSAFQFLTIGYPIGERTLLKDVHIQLPSSIIVFNGDAAISSRYWNVPKRISSSANNIGDSVAMVAQAVEDTVCRLSTLTKEPLALGMSGGHDSRVLLSALAFQNLPFTPIRWADNNFNDEVARGLCALLQKPLHIMRERSYEEIMAIRHNVFRYSDGFYFYPDGFTRLGQECFEQQRGSLLLGYGGDVVSGATIIPDPQYLNGLEDLAHHTLKNHMELLGFNDTLDVMKNVDTHVLDETLLEWQQSFGDYSSCESLLDIAIHQGLTNREFKRVLFSMYPANEYVQVLYPYLDNKVLDAYFTLPIEMIKNRRLHCYAGYHRFEAFGDYRASGYPISLRTEAQYPSAVYALRWLGAKVKNSVLKFKKARLKTVDYYHDRDGDYQEYERAAREIKDCPLFDGEIIFERFLKGQVTPRVIRKLHTLSKFNQFYLR